MNTTKSSHHAPSVLRPRLETALLAMIVLASAPQGLVGQDYPAAPTLGVPQMFAGFTVTGTTGAVYQVQYVTDLAETNNWTGLTNVTLPASPWFFLDLGSPQSAKRFYRAVALSQGDNFSDNAKDAAKWGADMAFGTAGQMEEASGRLEFHSTGLDNQSAVRPWILGYGSYTNDWEVRADLNLGNISLAQDGSHVEMFLVAFNTGDVVNGIGRDHFGLSLDLYRVGGGTVLREFTPNFRTNNVAVGSGGDYARPATSPTVAVRISFDSATKTLTGWYDADGPANGYAWTLLRAEGLNLSGSNWEMNDASRFQFGLGASSEGFIVNTSHAVFADNLWVIGTVSP